MDLRSGIIKPKAPFSFNECLNYIKSFPASQNDHKIDTGQLIKAFSMGAKTYAMQIINQGNLEHPRFKLTIMSVESMDDQELEMAIQKVRFFLGVDEDIQEFYEIGNRDKMFKPLINKLYGHRMIKFLSVFESAVWSLLKSNLTLKEAVQHKKMLQHRLGNMINVNGINYRAFPQPIDLLEAPEDELEHALPQSRIRQRIDHIATYFSDLDVPHHFTDKSNDEIKDELLHLEGIDQGNTQYILNYGLGRLNEVHLGDPQLVQAVEKTYGTHYEVNQDTMKEIADKYKNWKAYWSHYLIIGHNQS